MLVRRAKVMGGVSEGDVGGAFSLQYVFQVFSFFFVWCWLVVYVHVYYR